MRKVDLDVSDKPWKGWGIGTLVLALALTALVSPAAAIPISTELTPSGLGLAGEQNVGFGPFIVNPFLSLSAITKIGQDGLPVGTVGTVFISNKGAGVQSDTFGGSKGISGVGPHGLEILILDFTPPAFTTTITFSLQEYNPAKEDASLFVVHAGGTVVIPPTIFEPLFLPLSKNRIVIDFANPGLGFLLDSVGPITRVSVKAEPGAHFFVNTATFVPTPEPATLLLLGTGLVGLGFMRRRHRLS